MPSIQGRPRTLLIELVHTELELRLKSREAARVEEYLARYPELADDRAAVLGLIAAEYGLRRRGEPDPPLDEYLAAFPQVSRGTSGAGRTGHDHGQCRGQGDAELAGPP